MKLTESRKPAKEPAGKFAGTTRNGPAEAAARVPGPMRGAAAPVPAANELAHNPERASGLAGCGQVRRVSLAFGAAASGLCALKAKRAKSTGPPGKGKIDRGKFDQGKEVRAIARERVGAVKPGQVIEDKKQRKKPKHKPPAGTWPNSGE